MKSHPLTPILIRLLRIELWDLAEVVEDQMLFWQWCLRMVVLRSGGEDSHELELEIVWEMVEIVEIWMVMLREKWQKWT